LDKGHGRIEERHLWCRPIEPQTVGLAGVAQIARIDRHIQHVRKGKVIKETRETAFAITSYLQHEASSEQLLQIARDHWSIENGQHHRRDRTQDEDRCGVRDTTCARNLSLFRSLSIFLFKRQSVSKRGKKSLPDFEHHVHRRPWGILRQLTQGRHDESIQQPRHKCWRYAP
jgi:predicted transposase YbfD/YdcC